MDGESNEEETEVGSGEEEMEVEPDEAERLVDPVAIKLDSVYEI